MKALSKPISSPNRAEKLPPPLMTFLRSNTASRSRGRSRSTPIFYISSKRSTSGVIETTEEPSSPKVTCIGQVRATSSTSKPGGATVTHRRWWLFKKTLKILSEKRGFRRNLSKWGLSLRSGYCKKVDATEDSFRVCSKKNENLETGDEESERDFVDDSCYPPKNALILMRCRSVPYRSSSSSQGRFWSSPLTENEAKSEELEKPRCENEVENSRISQESGKELENSRNDVEHLKGIAGGAVQPDPMLLTRCKSQPARTGQRLNPDKLVFSPSSSFQFCTQSPLVFFKNQLLPF